MKSNHSTYVRMSAHLPYVGNLPRHVPPNPRLARGRGGGVWHGNFDLVHLQLLQLDSAATVTTTTTAATVATAATIVTIAIIAAIAACVRGCRDNFSARDRQRDFHITAALTPTFGRPRPQPRRARLQFAELLGGFVSLVPLRAKKCVDQCAELGEREELHQHLKRRDVLFNLDLALGKRFLRHALEINGESAECD